MQIYGLFGVHVVLSALFFLLPFEPFLGTWKNKKVRMSFLYSPPRKQESDKKVTSQRSFQFMLQQFRFFPSCRVCFSVLAKNNLFSKVLCSEMI